MFSSLKTFDTNEVNACSFFSRMMIQSKIELFYTVLPENHLRSPQISGSALFLTPV